MNQFPCINPVCSHLFSADELTGATALKCPKCGQEIQFRGAAPSAPPVGRLVASPVAKTSGGKIPVGRLVEARKKPLAVPAVPVAKPVSKPVAKPVPPVASPVRPANPPPPPLPSPIKPAVPVARVVAPSPSALSAGPPPIPLQSRFSAPSDDDSLSDLDRGGAAPTFRPVQAPRAQGLTWLYVLGIGFIILGGILAVVLAVRRFGGSGDDQPLLGDRAPKYPKRDLLDKSYEIVNVEGKGEVVFKILLPKDRGWIVDEEFRKKFGARTAWYDKDNGVWLVVGATDFGLHEPREAQLLQDATERLTGPYGETLELEQVPKPAQVGGQTTRKLDFKGTDGGTVAHQGEMHYFSYRGIGFLVLMVGPSWKKCREVHQWLEEKNLGLALLDVRKGWTPQPPKMETFKSATELVSLKVPHGVYEKVTPLKGKDGEVGVEAELYLLGRYRKEADNTKNAHVQVIPIAAAADLETGMEKALDQVLKQWTTEEVMGYKLEVSPEAGEGMGKTGKEVDVGGRKGRVGDFCMKREGKAVRFFLVEVMEEGGQLFALVCDVPWDNRAIWHEEFHALAETLRIGR